jgi:hypothetical protein
MAERYTEQDVERLVELMSFREGELYEPAREFLAEYTPKAEERGRAKGWAEAVGMEADHDEQVASVAYREGFEAASFNETLLVAAAEERGRAKGWAEAVAALRDREVWRADDPHDEYGAGQFVVLTAAADYLDGPARMSPRAVGSEN